MIQIRFQNSAIKYGRYFFKFLPSLVLLLFFLTPANIVKAQTDRLFIKGDSLKNIDEGGERYREVIGNVEIYQGNLKITCNTAKDYYEKNEAELIGNVVAVQDTITIKTPRGHYWGNTRTVYSDAGVELSDSHYNLKAVKGFYYFNEKKADFTGDVNMSDKNSNLRAGHLTYYRDSDSAVAVNNVVVSDTSSVVFADSLIHNRKTRVSYGFNNVRIFNPLNKSIILAGRFANNDSTGYSKISVNPVFIQIDSTADGKADTLYISAKDMEAYQDSTDRFVASDSVKMFRTNFAAVNNLTTLFRKENRIFTYRLENDTRPPVVWYENSQLYGDSVYIEMEQKKLKLIKVFQNAFMLSLNEGYEFRYDQMSGRKIYMNFDAGEIKRIDIEGALLSIYYLYDNKEPNGLVKASSERGKMYFTDKKVDDVKLYGAVVSEYHPENVILGKEKDFTLPGFIIYKDRPVKKDFEMPAIKKALIELDEIIKNENGKYPNLKKREPEKSL